MTLKGKRARVTEVMYLLLENITLGEDFTLRDFRDQLSKEASFTVLPQYLSRALLKIRHKSKDCLIKVKPEIKGGKNHRGAIWRLVQYPSWFSPDIQQNVVEEVIIQ